jgi:hypothetical protein
VSDLKVILWWAIGFSFRPKRRGTGFEYLIREPLGMGQGVEARLYEGTEHAMATDGLRRGGQD